MGCWGAKMTENDEFCDVYDTFIEKYDNGESVEKITEELLNEYKSEFDEDDGIFHEVYFAIAKAQWMCGALDEKIFRQVKEIIESGKNLEYQKELEAKETFLKQRKKELEKFLVTISTPRPKARKRYPPKKLVDLPPLNKGEYYSYAHGEGRRILLFLGLVKKERQRDRAFVCILKNEYKQIPTPSELLEQEIGLISMYLGEDFISASKLKLEGTVEMPNDSLKMISKVDFYGKGSLSNVEFWGQKAEFNMDFATSTSLRVKDFFALDKLTYKYKDVISKKFALAMPKPIRFPDELNKKSSNLFVKRFFELYEKSVVTVEELREKSGINAYVIDKIFVEFSESVFAEAYLYMGMLLNKFLDIFGFTRDEFFDTEEFKTLRAELDEYAKKHQSES